MVVDDARVVDDDSVAAVGDASGHVVDYGSVIDDCIAIVMNCSIVCDGSHVVHGSINCYSTVIRNGVL